MLKILQARLQQYVNREFPDVQAVFRKGREEPEIKLPTSVRSLKSKKIPEKHLLYWLHQSHWLCGSPQTVKNSSVYGNTRPLDLPPEKICMQVKKQQLELDMEQQTGSK